MGIWMTFVALKYHGPCSSALGTKMEHGVYSFAFCSIFIHSILTRPFIHNIIKQLHNTHMAITI